jgi:ABC-type Fe3+ transport system permease subunit
MLKPERRNVGRTVVAFFLTPLLGMIASAIVVFIQHPEGFGWLDGRIPRLQGAITYVMIFGVYAYLGMLMMGLPLHWLLRRFRLQRVWLYLFLGPVAALLFIMAVAVVINLRFQSGGRFVFIPFLFGILHPVIIGAVTFTAFWYIAVRSHVQTKA